MKTLLHDMDIREEGREEGREAKTYKVVKNMLNKGIEVETICELAECSEEYVKQVSKDIAQN